MSEKEQGIEGKQTKKEVSWEWDIYKGRSKNEEKKAREGEDKRITWDEERGRRE